MLPNEIKGRVLTQNDLVLLLDEESARYPWELLDDRWSQGERPAVRRTRFAARQLESTEFRSAIRGAPSPRRWVIGDPVSQYPELKGAQAEAEAVGRELSSQGGFQVEKRIRPTAAGDSRRCEPPARPTACCTWRHASTRHRPKEAGDANLRQKRPEAADRQARPNHPAG